MQLGAIPRDFGLRRGTRRKNRTRIEIAASMLEIAKQGVRKTQLMYQGNLSFELLQKYLKSLTQSGLIERKQMGNQYIYKTTQKGLQFLRDYEDLQQYAAAISSKKSSLEKLLGR